MSDGDNFRHPHCAEFLWSSTLLITTTVSYQLPVAAHISLVVTLPSPRISASSFLFGLYRRCLGRQATAGTVTDDPLKTTDSESEVTSVTPPTCRLLRRLCISIGQQPSSVRISITTLSTAILRCYCGQKCVTDWSTDDPGRAR
jgi:hypothetical protein